MERYTVGRMIEQGQIDFGVSGKELYEGVLTPRKLEQIKKSDEVGDRVIWDFLIERLCVCPENLYKCYVSDEEIRLEKMRREINESLNKLREYTFCDYDMHICGRIAADCDKILNIYRIKLQETNASVMGSLRVHELFCEVSQGWLLLVKQFQPDITPDQKTEDCNILCEYITSTWNAIHDISIEEWIKGESAALSLLEVELLVLYAHALEGLGNRSKAKKILEWICIPFLFSTYRKRNSSHIKALPYVINLLAMLERKDGNQREAAKLQNRLRILEKRWNTEMGDPYSMSAVWDNVEINADSVIEKCRKEKGLSQHILAENIMEPETYSRYESGKIRVRWSKKAQLLEKLGENSSRVQLFVDNEHPKVVSASVRIAKNLENNNYFAAVQEYTEVKCWLSSETEVNRKFMETVERKLEE